MEVSTCEVLRRCASRGGDREWSELVGCLGPRVTAGVRGALRRMGLEPTREQVEDLTQDVYCHLLAGDGARLRSFAGRSDGEAASWLGRLARNVALDTIRVANATKRRAGQLVALDRCGDAGEPAVAEPDVEQRLLAREERHRFWRLASDAFGSGVSARDRTMFRLAVGEGLSSREIAARLGGLSIATVDSVLHRLRGRLARSGVSVPRRGPSAGRRRTRRAPASRQTVGTE